MREHENNKKIITKREITAVILIGLLFFVSTYFSQTYLSEIKAFIGEYDVWGVFVYGALAFAGTVVAPISTLPLVPLAVASWGSFYAGILSIIAWTLGSVVAFIIARRFGKPIIGRFFDLRRAEALGEKLGSHNIFWTVLFARIVIPIDLLSYAIGLFVPISLGAYTLATIIGITPFAFVFSYASALPIYYTIGASLLALFVMFFGYLFLTKKRPLHNGDSHNNFS